MRFGRDPQGPCSPQEMRGVASGTTVSFAFLPVIFRGAPGLNDPLSAPETLVCPLRNQQGCHYPAPLSEPQD